MRELISYKMDEITGELIERIKQKPEQFAQGHAKIELFRAWDGKLVEKQETDNIFLGMDWAVRWALHLLFMEAFGMMTVKWGYYSQDNLCNMFSCMYLTDYTQPENSNNVILKGMPCGIYYNAYGRPGPQAPLDGNFNNTESYSFNTPNGNLGGFRRKEHKVIDFPTDRGNGNFQSIWWTNPNWAYTGGGNTYMFAKLHPVVQLPRTYNVNGHFGIMADQTKIYNLVYSSNKYYLDVIDHSTYEIIQCYDIQALMGPDWPSSNNGFNLVGIDDIYIYFSLIRSSSVVEVYKFDKNSITKAGSKITIPSSVMTTMQNGTNNAYVYVVQDGANGDWYLRCPWSHYDSATSRSYYDNRFMKIQSDFSTPIGQPKTQSAYQYDEPCLGYYVACYDGYFYFNKPNDNNNGNSYEDQIFDFDNGRAFKTPFHCLTTRGSTAFYSRYTKRWYGNQNSSYVCNVYSIYPMASHTLLTAPVTKTNLHTMKIQYDIEYNGFDLFKDLVCGR